MLIAPSSAITLVRRVISPCSEGALWPSFSTAARAVSSAPASRSCCANCSLVIRAACSFSLVSAMRSRRGWSFCSPASRASSEERSLAAISSWRVRPREGLLPSDPRRQALLKLAPQHLIVHTGQLGLELFEASLGILNMLQYDFRRSFYLADFTYTILFRVTCLLKLTLGLHHGLALRFQLELRGVPIFLRGFELTVERVDLALTPLEACLRSALGGPLLGLLAGNFSELPVDLPAALLVALLPLSQLEVFQLTLVMALFERRSRHAQLGETFVVLDERALKRGELRALFLDRIAAPARIRLQRFDFALSRKDSGVRRIGRVKADAESAELVTLAVDKHCMGRQPHSAHQPRPALHGVERRKPCCDDAAHRGVGRPDVVGKRLQSRLEGQFGIRSSEIGADPRGRRVLEQALQQLGVGHLHRMKALAQGRFHRGFPAGFDPNFLPQPWFRRELVPADPILDLAVLLDLVLYFLQREQPALQGRELALEQLQAVDAPAALPVKGLPRGFELGEQRFLAGELGTALRQFLRQMRAQLRVGRDQLGAFGEQLLLALLQPLQRLAGVREVCLFHLERLLGLCDALAFARDPSLQQARRLLRF